MSGWIKIYRELADHWLAQHPEKLGWWVLLLLKVAHEDKRVLVGNQIVELKRGQIAASFSFLAELWQTSKRTAERFIELLEKDKMLSRCVSRKVTIITICNYESYQENKVSKRADECADDEPIVSRLRDEIKKNKEDKEIYIQANSACAREENIQTWDASKEQGFYQTFKGQGAAVPMATKTGRSGREILQLLDVYMAHRQLKNLGHSDYNSFVSLFAWHIENNKISIPTQTKTTPKKVVAGAEILKIYG